MKFPGCHSTNLVLSERSVSCNFDLEPPIILMAPESGQIRQHGIPHALMYHVFCNLLHKKDWKPLVWFAKFRD